MTPDEELQEALAGDAEAKEKWDALAPSHKREYLTWIAEAKKVRAKRIADTLERLKK